jgi:hypothetical protein
LVAEEGQRQTLLRVPERHADHVSPRLKDPE